MSPCRKLSIWSEMTKSRSSETVRLLWWLTLNTTVLNKEVCSSQTAAPGQMCLFTLVISTGLKFDWWNHFRSAVTFCRSTCTKRRLSFFSTFTVLHLRHGVPAAFSSARCRLLSQWANWSWAVHVKALMALLKTLYIAVNDDVVNTHCCWV